MEFLSLSRRHSSSRLLSSDEQGETSAVRRLPIYNWERMGLAPFSTCKMEDLCPAPCWLIGFAGFRQRQVCRDPFLATAFMLELQLWQPVMASWITWLKNWVTGQAKRISYISAPHLSLLLSWHLNCPSLDCLDSCSAGSPIRHWLSQAFGIATFLVCLTFSRFLLFLAQVYTSPISCVCLMA